MDGDNQFNSAQQYNPEASIRDIEERERILKERILLIGKNLVDIKEKNSKEILELKKEIGIIKQDVKRMLDFLESLSGEISKFARKDELQVLSKQAKMFQPLEFVTKTELKKILKMNSHEQKFSGKLNRAISRSRIKDISEVASRSNFAKSHQHRSGVASKETGGVLR